MAAPGGATAVLPAPRAGVGLAGGDPVALVAEMVRLQRRRVLRSACAAGLGGADAQHMLLRGSSDWPGDSAGEALALPGAGAWSPPMADELERELLLELLEGPAALPRGAAMRQRSEALARQASSLSQASSRYTSSAAFPKQESIGSQGSADSQALDTWVGLGPAPGRQASGLSCGASNGLQSLASLEEQAMLDLLNSRPALLSPALNGSVGASPVRPLQKVALPLQQPVRLCPDSLRTACSTQVSREGHALAARSTDEKKVKRLAANREAARRMRKRHSQRLAELEDQVKQLSEANEVTQEELEKAKLRIAELEDHNARLEQEAEVLRSLQAKFFKAQEATYPVPDQSHAVEDDPDLPPSKRPCSRSFCQDAEASASGPLACPGNAVRGLSPEAAPELLLQDCSPPSMLDLTDLDIFSLDA